MPKVIFKTWPEFDAFSTFHLIKNFDPKLGLEKAKELNLPDNIFQIIVEIDNFENISTEYLSYFDKLYEKYSIEISKAITNYQSEWNKINDTFFEEIKLVTNRNYNIEIFNVYLSPINEGLTNSTEAEIIRSAFEDAKEQTRFTAHEILMFHIWQYLKELYSKDYISLNYQVVWGVNEVISNAILGLNKNLNSLWTENQKGYDNYLQEYLTLEDLKQKVKHKYSELSFDELVKFAVENQTHVQTDK